MTNTLSADLTARLPILDKVANGVQTATRKAFEAGGPTGTSIREVLHGTWLGHPLHAAITDIPIGAWTTAVLMDALEAVSGREELRPGARAAVGIGLIGAAGAAITGLTDFQNVSSSPEARRTGMLHGLLNVLTTSCFVMSYAQRRQARGGRLWSVIGLGIGMTAAKLGGELVYKHGIGVDRAVEAPQSAQPVDERTA